MSTSPSELHYHLDVLGSARLRIKVQTNLPEDQTLSSWLRQNDIYCNPDKVIHPASWRISYGVLTRFAKALGYRKADKLYSELTAR